MNDESINLAATTAEQPDTPVDETDSRQEMAGFGSHNDDELVMALASGATVVEAARRSGVSERTAYRRLQDAEFRGRIGAARAELVSRAMGMMTDSMTEAADTLRTLLKAEREPVRLGAARSILELGQRLRESVELEARIAAMESKIESSDDGRTKTL